MQVVHSEALDIDGFAGLRERHYVMDSRTFGDHRKDDAAQGIGALVYLADAHFLRYGSTGRHGHRDVDIVTLVCNGRLLHRGTLADGSLFHSGDVLVQRAGPRGFEHDEINPDERPNRIIQIWMRPGSPTEEPDHQVWRWPEQGRQLVWQHAGTVLELVHLQPGAELYQDSDCGCYLIEGAAQFSDPRGSELVQGQAWIRAQEMRVQAMAETRLVLAYQTSLSFA